METLVQDVRYALRTLLKSPGFTALAVLCLALGIGVNTMIFSVVDAVLLSPFGFAEPERLVAIEETHVKSDIDDASPSFQNFRDWQTQATKFSDLAAQSWRSLTLSDGEEPERLQGGTVTWNLFPMLRVRPILGRGFQADEDRPGAPGVVLLSHDVWQRRYRGDSSVVGRSIPVNGASHTVVGVMPPGFKYPEQEELWVPLTPIEHTTPRSERGVAVVGRLKPGVSIEQARSEMQVIAKRLAAQYPNENPGWSVNIRPLRDRLVGEETRLVVLTMMGAVTFVLLIACTNVANLLLARGATRRREIAVRTAIGAGRGRIVRQLLTESVLIALLSAPFGLLLAVWGLDLIDAAIPPQESLPYYIHWSVDGAALLYTISVSVLTGIAFGLAPALQASQANLQETLKEGGRGSGAGVRSNRLRGALVVTEVALSLVLLVGASLFVKSFLNVVRASGGFDTAPLMTMRFYMPGDRYEAPGPKARRVEDIVRRIEALPGVEAATASNTIALGAGGSESGVVVEGRSVPRGEEPRISYTGVTAHWFKTLGVSLLGGRDFTEAEARDSSSVAIVNLSMAKKLWPSADPLGQRFRLVDDTTGEWLTVIGVSPDIRLDGIDEEEEPSPGAFLPYPYLSTHNTGLTIRTVGNPASITAAVRQEIRASDPALPVFEIQTMEKLRRIGFWYHRLFSWMFSIFGGIALFLAAIGVYGVISYGVAQRTHEIGVRMALGASRADVLGLVVRHGMLLALSGVGLGLLGALAVTRVVGSILYDVSPTDPLSFTAVTLFLAGVALMASYFPARRATRVDPMVALRYE